MAATGEDDERRKGAFGQLFQLLGGIFSVRVLVAIAASTAVTAGVGGTMAAKAIQARREARAAASPTSSAPTTEKGQANSIRDPSPPAGVKPPVPPVSPAVNPSTTASSSTTTAPPGAAVTLVAGTAPPTVAPATTPPAVTTTRPVAAVTTTVPATAPATTAAPTTAAPTTTTKVAVSSGSIEVAAESSPDQFFPLNGSRIELRNRIRYVAPAGVTTVEFWLDNAVTAAPTRVDSAAPFDLVEFAQPVGNWLDTTQLKNGRHTVHIHGTGSADVVGQAEFEVLNGTGD